MIDTVIYVVIVALITGLPVLLLCWLLWRKRTGRIRVFLQVFSIILFGAFFTAVYTAEETTPEFEIVSSDVCNPPFTISIGTIDTRFNLSSTKAGGYIAEAIDIWEEASTLDLFDYMDASSTDIVVDFVFDKRQAHVIEEKRHNSTLALYERDLAEHNVRVEEYNRISEHYDTLLQEYEAEVENWNNLKRREQTQEEYDRLEQKRIELNLLVEDINLSQDALESERLKLESRRIALNISADRLNRDLNGGHTIGEYNGIGTINIYQYASDKEVINVLAHELGHALGSDHVADPNSIMYATSSPEQKISEFDLEFLTEAIARRDASYICN